MTRLNEPLLTEARPDSFNYLISLCTVIRRRYLLYFFNSNRPLLFFRFCNTQGRSAKHGETQRKLASHAYVRHRCRRRCFTVGGALGVVGQRNSKGRAGPGGGGSLKGTANLLCGVPRRGGAKPPGLRALQCHNAPHSLLLCADRHLAWGLWVRLRRRRQPQV